MMSTTTTTRKGRARLPVPSSSTRRAGLPLVLDLGPALVYVVRRLARHVEALPDGDVLAVDVGARRVIVERRADGWTLDGGAELPTLAAVLAELQAAAAAWLAEGAAA